MNTNMPDPVDAILDACGLRGSWEPLHATGIANRIYATRDVVIRIATDNPDALPDARTESVAAPVAYAAGIPSPRLIAFDHSLQQFDRAYSVWERIYAETLGLLSLEPPTLRKIWREVGQQLAHLNRRVESCADPDDYLDDADRSLDLYPLLQSVEANGHIHKDRAREISRLIDQLHPAMLNEAEVRFLHNDIHAMNVMCTVDGDLRAIIDWGDAGWGDPTVEFAQIPLSVIPYALEGYREIAPDLLGDAPKARIIWDKLEYALDELVENPSHSIPLATYWRFLNEA